MQEITAIILAGGLATRLGEQCEDTPKGMLLFNEVPFLKYLVSWLVRLGISEVMISVGHLDDDIGKEFGTFFWANKGVRLIKEYKPLGTGGAVRYAASHTHTKQLFLCNGDTVVDIDLEKAYAHHEESESPVTAILTTSTGVPNQGAVLVEEGIVTEFREGLLPQEIFVDDNAFRASSTGSYLLERELVMGEFPQARTSLEREVLPSLVNARKVGGFNNDSGFFWDFGTPERLEQLQREAHKLIEVYGHPMRKHED